MSFWQSVRELAALRDQIPTERRAGSGARAATESDILAQSRNRPHTAGMSRRKPKVQEFLSATETAELLDIAVTTLYGLVEKGEIQRVPGREPFAFDKEMIVKLAAARADHPKPRARDGTLRGRPRQNPEDEKVKQFGRATEAEVARWKRAATAEHKGNVWPWLRELANRAADKAGV